MFPGPSTNSVENLERTTGFEPATLTLASRPEAAEHRTEPSKSGPLRTFDLPISPVDCRWLRLLGIVCRTNDGRNRMRIRSPYVQITPTRKPRLCGLPHRTVSPRRGRSGNSSASPIVVSSSLVQFATSFSCPSKSSTGSGRGQTWSVGMIHSSPIAVWRGRVTM